MKILAVIPGTGKGADMIFARRQVEVLKICGVQIHQFFIVSRTSPLYVIKEWMRLIKEIKSYKPDVVHCHYGTMTAFITIFSTCRPIVITYRGSDINPVPSGSRIRTLLGHIMSQIASVRANRIICVSRELKDKLWLSKSSTVVIPTGVDTSVFRPIPKIAARLRLGWNITESIVLFNAGASPNVKRLDLAEMAVDCARKRGAKFKFMILNGDVPPEDMPLYYNAADTLLFTSDYEGSPTVIQEAIACGLPVVSVAVGDVVDRLVGVFPSKIVSRDPSSLGNAVFEMLSYKVRSNGPVVAVSSIDVSKSIQQVLSVLQTACGLTD